MADSIKVGAHWALIETTTAPWLEGAWVGQWAVYNELSLEAYVESPEQRAALVSGTTAPQRTQAEARRVAELDARRSEAVLSGTYND